MRPDITAMADDLARVAAVRGLPLDTLRASVAAFNRAMSGESSDTFGWSRRSQPW